MAESLELRVHRNLIGVYALMAERMENEGDALLAAMGSEMPFLNTVLRKGPGGDAAALIQRARGFFFSMGRGFVVYTWPGDPDLGVAAEQAGLTPVNERYPEMVCTSRLAPLPGAIEPVDDVQSATEYWAICDEAYPSLGFPPGLFQSTFSPRDLLERDGVEACIARDGGRGLACAQVIVLDGVGFVGWVAAVPEARGRGLAAACTVWATNRTFELGADVASLQASKMGESLYRRLGYEELFSYRLMGATPPAPAD